MLVEDVMTTPARTCALADSLEVPARLMWEHDVGAVPVVDPTGRVVGMVTDRDVAMAALLRGRPLRDLPVAETMSREVATCAPTQDVAVAEETMAARRVRRLPVVDGDGRLVGVLALNDLARAVTTGEGPGVPASDVARTLREVCARPHRLRP